MSEAKKVGKRALVVGCVRVPQEQGGSGGKIPNYQKTCQQENEGISRFVHRHSSVND